MTVEPAIPGIQKAQSKRTAALNPLPSALLAFLAGVVVGLGAMVVGATAFTLLTMPPGLSIEETTKRLEGRVGIIFASTGAFEIGLIAVACLWRSAGAPLRRKLGLVSPRLTPGQWLMLLVAAGVPFAISILAAWVMPAGSSAEGIANMWKSMSAGTAIAWIAFVGIGPGIAEETFFRGLIQRILLRGKSPLFSIGLTSFLFALVHVEPAAMALALVLGIWLGVIAWKTGSIFPTIATHLLINSGWNLAQVTLRQHEVPEWQIWTGVGALGAISLVCFVLTVRMLIARRAEPVPGQEPTASEIPAAQSS